MAAEVVSQGSGWIVSEIDHNGRLSYVGRDGFWTRIPQAAAPFASKQAAQDQADAQNAIEHPHKFR